jgi:FkbH-like protein
VTLLEALKVLKQPSQQAVEPFDVFLACGVTPLHLQTFVTAHLRQAFPNRAVHVTTGLYGDLVGNIERMGATAPHAGIVTLEWEDIDPRLGIRKAGDWTKPADILDTALAGIDRLRSALAHCKNPVALSLPTLDFAPLWHYPGWQANPFQAQIKERLASFEHWASTTPNIRIVNLDRLARMSPPATRHDVNSHILNGFPYTQGHTAALAELLVLLVRNSPPKKGLITDLDNTFWHGIVGEIGPEQVSWDLDHKSHMHGVYQRFLAALAQEGVLIAVASKNDISVVERALQRDDILIGRDSIWPVEANWSAKSGAIARILQAWNVGPESVVFVDDSPMELAEVKATHPEMECVLFPGQDYNRILEMMVSLRDAFGKSTVSAEDAIRLSSLRASATARQESASGTTPDAFLAGAAARMSLSFSNPPEPRALELINKTNQFNLNGRRYAESDWQRSLSRSGAMVVTAAYDDKFGPLGTVLVLHGCVQQQVLFVDSWVMSCRAFSRRIEYKCLEQLYEQLEVEEIEFDFAATDRNGPLQEMFTVLLGRSPEPKLRLSRADFAAKCPPLFITVSQTAAVS